MENKCVFNFPSKHSWCKKGEKKNPPPTYLNIATEAKIKSIEAYTASWIHKILQFGYDGVIFFDCMCNSGSYLINERYPDKQRHGEIEKGTSARVHKLFLEASKQYKDKQFILMLNDNDINQILCQYCRLELNFTEIQNEVYINNNYKIIFYNNDAKHLLLCQETQALTSGSFHMLLFYDPYECIIEWDALKPYIESNSVDLIINHMIMDACRGISQTSEELTKRKYSSSYRINIEELKEKLMEMNSRRKYDYLRNCVKKIVYNYSPRSLVVSSPFFNSSNALMYDLLLISKSKIAKKLFKETTYRFLKDRFGATNEVNYSQLTWYDNEPKKEYEIYSSINYFARVVYSHFKGKGLVPLNELNTFLEEHDILPPNCKRELDKELKELYSVKKTKQGYCFNKVVCYFE